LITHSTLLWKKPNFITVIFLKKTPAFSGDGKRIVSGGSDKTVKVWEWETGKCLQTMEGHRNSVRSVAFSPQGDNIVSGSEDKTVKVWSSKTGKCLQTLAGHQDSVLSIAFSGDGKSIISGSGDETVKVWGLVLTSAGGPISVN